MIKIKKVNFAYSTLILITAITGSGCTFSRLKSYPRLTISQKENSSTIEGDWLNENGIAVSNFIEGTFSTTALDTGKQIANGSYIQSNGNKIIIQGTSLIRQMPIEFNCLLVKNNQMNCTNTQGQHFILRRKENAL